MSLFAEMGWPEAMLLSSLFVSTAFASYWFFELLKELAKEI